MLINFREICKCARGRVVHNIEQEPDQNQKEDQIDMVNINSISFNNKHFVITTNLETSSNEVRIRIPYKVDTGIDGSIIPLHICKKYFLEQQKNNWW